MATPKSPPAKAPNGKRLPLPHDRDESVSNIAQAPDPQIVQAKRDLDAGQVDTDMRATPGLDAKRREALVPGPGGKPVATRSRT
jgi:hypothetical protein